MFSLKIQKHTQILCRQLHFQFTSHPLSRACAANCHVLMARRINISPCSIAAGNTFDLYSTVHWLAFIVWGHPSPSAFWSSCAFCTDTYNMEDITGHAKWVGVEAQLPWTRGTLVRGKVEVILSHWTLGIRYEIASAMIRNFGWTLDCTIWPQTWQIPVVTSG